MRIALDLPEDLLAEAMKISGANKAQTIIAALEGLVRKDKLEQLRKYRGRVALDEINLDDLRDRGSARKNLGEDHDQEKLEDKED